MEVDSNGNKLTFGNNKNVLFPEWDGAYINIHTSQIPFHHIAKFLS